MPDNTTEKKTEKKIDLLGIGVLILLVTGIAAATGNMGVIALFCSWTLGLALVVAGVLRH